jgi:hypothetical protein
MSEEAQLLAHYMPLVIRARSTRAEDRRFALGVVARTRAGLLPTEKQVWRMRRVVQRFKDMEMTE